MGNKGSNTVTANLIDAVKSRDESKVRDLILGKTSLNETDVAGNGALHIIAKEGHYKYPPTGIPKLLIDSGIDVNMKNGNGATALEISLLSGWQKVLPSPVFSSHILNCCSYI